MIEQGTFKANFFNGGDYIKNASKMPQKTPNRTTHVKNSFFERFITILEPLNNQKLSNYEKT